LTLSVRDELEMLQALEEGLIDKILEGVPLDRATSRWEFKKCQRPNWCYSCRSNVLNGGGHGPYLYLYWKNHGKLRKRYVGKWLSETEYKKRVEEFTSQSASLGNR
jgi:hypothetical protein